MEEPNTPTPLVSPSNKVGLYKKLLAVLQEVRYIQKDGNNSFHKYNYVTEAAVKDRQHEAFMNHGILFHLSITDMKEVVDGKNRLVTCKFAYKFIDVDTGEAEEGTSYGTGVDSLDKGLYKAIAGGIKYILTSNFLIATGDDPEDDRYETDQAKQEQVAAPATKKKGSSKANGSAPAGPSSPAPTNGSPTPAKGGNGAACHVCGDEIVDYTSKKGRLFTADVLVSESTKKYGVPMCASCQVAKGQEAQQGAGARVQ
jgi:hypothetical protein